MLAQLVQDLVHLEGGRDRLDQDGRPDRATRDAEPLLGEHEDLVPETRLVVATRAWAGTGTARTLGATRSAALWNRYSPASNSDADIGVPSTRTWLSTRCQPRGRTTSWAVRSPSRYDLPSGDSNVERATDGIDERRLSGDDVGPRRRERVLEVGHEHPRPRIEGVDHHLGLGRTGDLDAPVIEVGRCRSDGPVGLADVARPRQEVERHAVLELGLALLASLQEVDADRAEPTLQVGDEGEGVVGQDPVGTRDRRARDDDAVERHQSPSSDAPSPRSGRAARSSRRTRAGRCRCRTGSRSTVQ